jgi:hypothetical protein
MYYLILTLDKGKVSGKEFSMFSKLLTEGKFNNLLRYIISITKVNINEFAHENDYLHKVFAPFYEVPKKEPKNEEDAKFQPNINYGISFGFGKRKTSVARVWINAGSGRFLINGKLHTDYFDNHILNLTKIAFPLFITNSISQFDIRCKVKGGGTNSQGI